MDKKDVFSVLDSENAFDYGSFIEGDRIRSLAEISVPRVGTKEEFNKAALAELNVIEYIRSQLVGTGRYIKCINGDYRILTPSENQKQVQSFMESADKKLHRAMTLSKNTPKEHMKEKDNNASRLLMKQEKVLRSKKLAGLMG